MEDWRYAAEHLSMFRPDLTRVSAYGFGFNDDCLLERIRETDELYGQALCQPLVDLMPRSVHRLGEGSHCAAHGCCKISLTPRFKSIVIAL